MPAERGHHVPTAWAMGSDLVFHQWPVGIKSSLNALGKPCLSSPDWESKTQTGHLLAQPPEIMSIPNSIRSPRELWIRTGPHCLCQEALSS